MEPNQPPDNRASLNYPRQLRHLPQEHGAQRQQSPMIQQTGLIRSESLEHVGAVYQPLARPSQPNPQWQASHYHQVQAQTPYSYGSTGELIGPRIPRSHSSSGFAQSRFQPQPAEEVDDDTLDEYDEHYMAQRQARARHTYEGHMQQHHHHRLPSQTRALAGHRVSMESLTASGMEVEGTPSPPTAAHRGPKVKFTAEDDARLIELKERSRLTWKQIAEHFPGRTSGTLQVRYCTKLKEKEYVWTNETIAKLRNAMADYERDKWRIIAGKVGQGFTPAACMEQALLMEAEEEALEGSVEFYSQTPNHPPLG